MKDFLVVIGWVLVGYSYFERIDVYQIIHGIVLPWLNQLM